MDGVVHFTVKYGLLVVVDFFNRNHLILSLFVHFVSAIIITQSVSHLLAIKWHAALWMRVYRIKCHLFSDFIDCNSKQ